MTSDRHHKTRFVLREASEQLLIAFWTSHPFHLREARSHLTNALCGGDFDVLVDCIEEVIRTNPDGPAYAVALALLDSAIPLNEKGGVTDEQVS